MIRRPPVQDDEDNPERWLVSYADFITLLFAFFVVMYAISSVNVSKYEALTDSVGSAFKGSELKDSESDQHNQQAKTSIIKPLPLSYLYQKRSKLEQEKMQKMGIALANQLSPQIQNGTLNIMQTNRGIRIDISNSLLFESGSATLAAKSSPILTAIANVIRRNERLVQIEGHTDSTPIHNASFYSNWELSAVRASTVVRMMVEKGIKKQRLSAVGYSDTLPISKSNLPFDQAKNRRVSIMVLYESRNNKQEAKVIKPQPRKTSSPVQRLNQ